MGLGLGVCLEDRAETLVCPGVVVGARRQLAQHLPDLLQQSLGTVPLRRQDQDLTGDAVVAGVVHLAGHDVLGLEAEVRIAPRPGGHDARADAAQLTAERLADQRRVVAAALRGLLVGPPHDRVVGAVAAGDMDGVHAVVRGEMAALRRTAVDEPQPAALDELGEDQLEVRPEVGVDRVHLSDDDLALDIQLVQDVQGGDGRDIARAQHQGDGRASGPPAVLAGGPVPHLLRAGARAHPHLGGEPVEQQGVPAGSGEDVDPGAAVPLVHGSRVDRILARGDPAQHVQVGADVLGERPRGVGPVLGRPRGVGAVALGAGSGRGRLRGAVGDSRQQPLQQRDPLGDRGRGPGCGAFTQLGDGTVERFGVDGRGGHGSAPSAAGVVGRVSVGQASRRAVSRARAIRLKAAHAHQQQGTGEQDGALVPRHAPAVDRLSDHGRGDQARGGDHGVHVPKAPPRPAAPCRAGRANSATTVNATLAKDPPRPEPTTSNAVFAPAPSTRGTARQAAAPSGRVPPTRHAPSGCRLHGASASR